MYIGGQVSYLTKASSVEVTEHAYTALESDESVALFDNSDGSGTVTEQTVVFENPVHDIVASSGLTLLSVGVNYAIVSGVGTLYGQEYTHLTKVIFATTECDVENTVTVTDATLVSLVNSQNVAKRLMEYYSTARQITTDFVIGSERPGDSVVFTNPFGDTEEGFLQSLDISISRRLRATAVFVADFVPDTPGNNYNNQVIIYTSGSWTVPSDVTEIRVILVGGGNGGSAGTNGGNATGGFAAIGDPGAGGLAGAGGTGGKVYNETISVAGGDVLSIAIGLGGDGGNTDGATGSAGGATTVGDLSSEDGSVNEYGFSDIFTGDRYGYTGEQGTSDGAEGCGPDGDGPSITVGDEVYTPGGRGDDDDDGDYGGTGGYGGGAAYANDGSDGGDAESKYNGGNGWGEGGAGGTGANGSPGTSSSVFGVGGQGGCGGGGGGTGGYGYNNKSGTSYRAMGDAGSGGSGGSGGDGADGCVIIYY